MFVGCLLAIAMFQLISADLSLLASSPDMCTVDIFRTLDWSIKSILKAENEADGYFIGTGTKLRRVTDDVTIDLLTQVTDAYRSTGR